MGSDSFVTVARKGRWKALLGEPTPDQLYGLDFNDRETVNVG
jgi:hypothetical protein